MDDLFFYSSKIIWLLISPGSLFTIFLLISFLLLVLKIHRIGMLLLTIVTCSTLFLSFFSIGDWLLYPLETRFQHNPQLPKKIDGIIVLGGSIYRERSQEWQQLETNSFHERLSYFIELARQYPSAKLIFTGGNASLDHSGPSEAEMVEQHFVNNGIPQARLIMEDQSRNTAENVLFSKHLAKPSIDENWLLITTASHQPRSVGIFCAQKWPVIPYPVDHKTVPSELYSPRFDLIKNAHHLEMAMHEWIGLTAYYLTGKTDRLFPAGCTPESIAS